MSRCVIQYIDNNKIVYVGVKRGIGVSVAPNLEDAWIFYDENSAKDYINERCDSEIYLIRNLEELKEEESKKYNIEGLLIDKIKHKLFYVVYNFPSFLEDNRSYLHYNPIQDRYVLENITTRSDDWINNFTIEDILELSEKHDLSQFSFQLKED